MVIFYKKWKKYNEIQLTKNKMGINDRKIINHPPSPVEGMRTRRKLQSIHPHARSDHTATEMQIERYSRC